jgi:hypothetical protein
MAPISLAGSLLGHSPANRIRQTAFDPQKLTLALAHNSLDRVALVLPEEPFIARLMARWDLGNFAQPAKEWQRLFEGIFDPVVFQQYRPAGTGVTVCKIPYFKRSRA